MITELLPCHVKVEWRRNYKEMTAIEKVHLFVYFMQFLDRERQAVARIAEVQSRRKAKRQTFRGNRREPNSITNVRIRHTERTLLTTQQNTAKSSRNYPLAEKGESMKC